MSRHVTIGRADAPSTRENSEHRLGGIRRDALSALADAQRFIVGVKQLVAPAPDAARLALEEIRAAIVSLLHELDRRS